MPANADCFSKEQLSTYAEGKLPVHEMDSVTAHLRDCVWCQSTLDWLKERLVGELDSDGELRPRIVDTASPDAPTRSYEMPLSRSDHSDGSGPSGPVRQLNGYVIVRVLGQGGYGKCKRCHSGHSTFLKK